MTHAEGRFEWDEAKAESNLAKHGIPFSHAITIFDGTHVATAAKKSASGEVRQMAIGDMFGLIIVAVVYTDRSGKTRIISARPASKKERKVYEARENQ